MAKLYFRYGAMGASKTANAIMVQYNYLERGQNALMLKPSLDTREGERMVGSRSGLRAPCAYVEELDQFDLKQYDCIIVDEAHFMKKRDVEKLVHIVDDLDIPVICYGLRADFQGNLFESSMWLMAWADTIEEIKTVCWCGRKATFNTRVSNGKVVKSGEQIVLGGNESYVSLCRKHWARGELAPMEYRKISTGKKLYLDLLLEADPSEKMIDRYLEDGEMYVLLINGQAVAVAVIKLLEDGTGGGLERVTCELCNLATRESERGKGYAKRLLEHLMKLYAPRCKKMIVGTSKFGTAFYERLGFTRAGERKGFFKDNYHPPVIENGEMLEDMLMLEKTL